MPHNAFCNKLFTNVEIQSNTQASNTSTDTTLTSILKAIQNAILTASASTRLPHYSRIKGQTIQQSRERTWFYSAKFLHVTCCMTEKIRSSLRSGLHIQETCKESGGVKEHCLSPAPIAKWVCLKDTQPLIARVPLTSLAALTESFCSLLNIYFCSLVRFLKNQTSSGRSKGVLQPLPGAKAPDTYVFM